MMWFPSDEKTLRNLLSKFIKRNPKNIHGIIVPHAGYEFSGEIAGKAFSLTPNFKHAYILGPSHYVYLNSIVSHNQKFWQTPLGKIQLDPSKFPTQDISKEHSIANQIPFIQFLNFTKITPLMVGEISLFEAEKISNLLDTEKFFVFSTDLSHFNTYSLAESIDKESISIIENLNLSKFYQIDACGINPLKILFHLCKKNNWKPHLIEYKNSVDITGDKSSVVGYASFWF